MWFVLTKCDAGEIVNFVWDVGGVNVLHTLTALDIGIKQPLPNVIMPPPIPDVAWNCSIHFSSPGDYELCFYLECPAVLCAAGKQIVADECMPCKVYQYKDAWKCEFEPKWNLWSLPLYPFDTDIDSIFASIDRPDQLKSVWYFGQCENPEPDNGVWHTEAYDAASGAFVPGDMAIQAGKAYWVRTLHPGETGYDAGAFPLNLWLFGTHAIMPEPPGMDMGYFDVCEGWNMVGFKPEWDLTLSPDAPIAEMDWVIGPPITGYLWNFNTGVMDTVHYGLIYQWVAAPVPGNWATWLPGTLNMQPTEGYWIPFDGDGEVYPKA